MSGVLVLVEHTGGEADRLSRETLTLGTTLAQAVGGELEAVLIGPGAEAVAESLGALGVRTAHVITDERLAAYAPAAWAGAVVELKIGRAHV